MAESHFDLKNKIKYGFNTGAQKWSSEELDQLFTYLVSDVSFNQSANIGSDLDLNSKSDSVSNLTSKSSSNSVGIANANTNTHTHTNTDFNSKNKTFPNSKSESFTDTNRNIILLNPRMAEQDFSALVELAQTAQEQMNLQDHVWIATSGSTAESASGVKLVALSKAALLCSATSVNQHLQATQQDVWAQVLPYFHVGGLGIELRARIVGAKVVQVLQDNKWSAQEFHNQIIKHKCSLSALVPTQVYDLVAQNLKCPSSIRAIVVGGGSLEEELYKKARSLGWPLLPSYGMTEACSQIATADLESLQSMQYPKIKLLSHVQVKTDEESFLQINSQALLTCYAQKTEQRVRVWSPVQQGWFTTEDQGQLKDRLDLKVFGRSKDYIKIGGEGSNLSALRSKLEQVILSKDANWLACFCLLAMPSPRLGSEIHLVTTLSSELANQAVNLYNEQVMPFEKIRKVHFVAEIPRTELGKIKWNELKGKLC